MIAYTTLGTRNLERSAAFYDAILGDLGATRAMASPRMVIWAVNPQVPMFAVCTPYDGEACTAGNGTMISLAGGTREQVNALHAKALSLGAKDEGQPGERLPGYYLAYFRDLDGNKLSLLATAA